MMLRLTALCSALVLLSATAAFAAPTKLHQQGRVLDGDGEPLGGTHGMSFALFDTETDGTELWLEERIVGFEAGYYSITLGEQVPLDDLFFDTESIWLELGIDGEVLARRVSVVGGGQLVSGYGGGGGGGSYNLGSNQSNTGGNNAGQGRVVISIP